MTYFRPQCPHSELDLKLGSGEKKLQTTLLHFSWRRKKDQKEGRREEKRISSSSLIAPKCVASEIEGSLYNPLYFFLPPSSFSASNDSTFLSLPGAQNRKTAPPLIAEKISGGELGGAPSFTPFAEAIQGAISEGRNIQHFMDDANKEEIKHLAGLQS